MVYCETDDYNSGREYAEDMAGRAMDKMEERHEKQVNSLRTALATAETKLAAAEAMIAGLRAKVEQARLSGAASVYERWADIIGPPFAQEFRDRAAAMKPKAGQ